LMVNQITRKILADKWHRHTNGLYYPGAGGLHPYGYDIAILAQDFLKALHRICGQYFESQWTRCLGWTVQTQHVVCCGYGWRDAGMNQLLLEWLHSSLNNRLYLLHKNAVSELFHRPYSFWMHRYEKLQKFGRLRIVDKWLCDLTSEDLLEIIRR
jgi:hypothetical protein